MVFVRYRVYLVNTSLSKLLRCNYTLSDIAPENLLSYQWPRASLLWPCHHQTLVFTHEKVWKSGLITTTLARTTLDPLDGHSPLAFQLLLVAILLLFLAIFETRAVV